MSEQTHFEVQERPIAGSAATIVKEYAVMLGLDGRTVLGVLRDGGIEIGEGFTDPSVLGAAILKIAAEARA